MDRNEIIEDSIVEFSQMEIGQAYSIRLVSGSIIFGVLAVKTEYLSDKSEIVKVHRIAFGNSKFLDLQEDDIEQINSFKDFSESHKGQIEYFKDFEKKYGVICTDCNDKLLSNATILNEVIDKNLWDELLEREKKEFLFQLDVNINDMVEVINAYVDCVREKVKFQENILEISEETVELLEKLKKIDKLYPNLDKIYDFFYKDLRISNLINLSI